MHTKRLAALFLLLCLMLNIAVGAVDSVAEPNPGLVGRTMLVLGDSYCAGYGLEDPEEDFIFVLGRQYRMTVESYAISGSSIAAGPTAYYPMVERAGELPEDVSPDFILFQGGSNDWARNIPLGEDGDTDPETFCGALNQTIDTLTARYPGAQIVGFTPWISNDTPNMAGYAQKDYEDAMLRIFADRGLLCYPAAMAEENGMWLNLREFRAEFCLSSGDWYHLNAAGHAMFAEKFGRWLETYLYPTSPTDRFYDLASAPEALKAAVSDLMEAGILQGTTEHLFAPSRTATRGALAVTLYRMAGRPETSAEAPSDVPPDSELYSAAAWAMETGILPDADPFSAGTPVTREQLALALYRYRFHDASADAYQGLGSYADGSEVFPEARIPMGWAMSEQLLPETDGLLRPQALVNRGQLAMALHGLRQLG